MSNQEQILVCANCETRGLESFFKDAEDVATRHSIGDVFSDKECPKCGALAFPKDNPLGIMADLATVVRRMSIREQCALRKFLKRVYEETDTYDAPAYHERELELIEDEIRAGMPHELERSWDDGYRRGVEQGYEDAKADHEPLSQRIREDKPPEFALDQEVSDYLTLAALAAGDPARAPDAHDAIVKLVERLESLAG